MSRRLDRKLADLARAGVSIFELHVTVEGLADTPAFRVACEHHPLESQPGSSSIEDAVTRAYEAVAKKLRTDAEAAKHAAELAEMRADRLDT